MFELSIAFGAGLISFLSPCVLPLIPGYISFISGSSLNQLSSVLTKHFGDVNAPMIYVGSSMVDKWLPGFRSENDIEFDDYDPLVSIWMGNKSFMKNQIQEKLKSGFSCLKMKIGALNFDAEMELLKEIRKEFSSNEIELRVDANGAFNPKNALEKLHRLSALEIHSIEQPIQQGQVQEMAELCSKTPLPIALDEELIGVFSSEQKKKLIATIAPQYIILKPSLIGGFAGSEEWINFAQQYNCGWWITSALESNVGLNAIAQFTYTLQSNLPQGLGTGGLFTNNFTSPLEVKNGTLQYDPLLNWNLNLL